MSPLGKYSQLVAAGITVLVIAAAVVGHLLHQADQFLDYAGLLALGAVFGASASTAATNGSLGASVTALHNRIDAAGIPAAADVVGPAGVPGPQGPQGPAGPAGQPGGG